MADALPDFTPVTLITGSLGSGKTTLLQRLLCDPALADTAVLINEFGEIGLDHHLLERIDETMVVLQSGCVCCTIRGELASAIKDLHSRRERGLLPPFRRLVVESTGLADPFPILSTVRSDPILRHHFCLGNVITTVDAVNGAQQLDTQHESVKQVAVADRLVLTKTDLAAAEATTRLTKRLRRINAGAPLWRAAEDDLDADALLSGEDHETWRPAEADQAVPDDHHRHADDIRTLALSIEEPIEWARFGVWLTMLLNRHGEALLRVKGILNVAGAATPVAVHAVQHLVHTPRHLEAWPDADRRSRLVIIARGLDPAAIERSFRAFVTPRLQTVGEDGMTEVTAFLANCRLADGRLVDIGISDGKISVLGEGAASRSNSAPALDIGGDLALPGLVDGHMHLDKTLTGLPWMGHAAGPTRMSRIETDKAILPHLPLSTEERAGNLIRECVARGTTHLRTHVDIDLESGLAKLEGVLAAREHYRDRVTVQIVAFPQSGVMRCPGVLDLLDAAVRNGADLVGGIDPLEIDRDPKGQLDGVFAIAERHGVGLDIHLHEPGEMGLFNVREICTRTKVLGLGGKVTISHGFCLGGIAERKAAEAAETMAEAGVALVTHGAGGLTLPPIEMLRAAGVLVFAGNDDIRDTWSPYGTGDLLERAAIIGWKGDFRRDPQMEIAFDLVSAAGARSLGINDYGITVGAAANLFTIAASCIPEAVAAHPPRKLVFFDGKIIARDGSFLPAPVPIARVASASI